MRAPFQILAIPYRLTDAAPLFCVFHRSDFDQWQFLAGGGEDDETPLEAAKREAFEEGGIQSKNWIELNSLCYLPACVIQENHRQAWPKDTFVIPEYTFGVGCTEEIALSQEHTAYVWLPYEAATEKLKWDSNRTALYELNSRLGAAVQSGSKKKRG